MPAEPTYEWVITPAGSRDGFHLYHADASAADVNDLWEYCRYCVTNLVWVNDHLVVEPNPRYLEARSDLGGRVGRVRDVLLAFYRERRVERERLAVAQRLVEELPTNDLPPVEEKLRRGRLW